MFRRCPDLAKLRRQLSALTRENADLHARLTQQRQEISHLRRMHDADQKMLGELRMRLRFLNDPRK